MKILKYRAFNYRTFEDSGTLNLSKKINIFIGRNSSGKSSLIRSIYYLQHNGLIQKEDVRAGSYEARILYDLVDEINSPSASATDMEIAGDELEFNYKVKINKNESNPVSPLAKGGKKWVGKNSFLGVDPHSQIYPFFSSRKSKYSTEINSMQLKSVMLDLQSLYSKIDFLNTPECLNYKEFKKSCEEIIGYKISTFPIDNGKAAGLILNSEPYIQLSQMGDGIPNLIGLICYLCGKSDKVFLIEELENDLHPAALKALLNLILEYSSNNQFFISTHSDIVLRILGADVSTKIFHTSLEFNERVPTSSIREVGNDKLERMQVLEEVGYSNSDNNMWDAWLFLEESSAERIIRNYLIPWFAPKLVQKLRTFSCSGTSKVEARFEEFDSLFVFVHLSEIYKNKCWIVVDGDDSGKESIKRLSEKYKGKYDTNNFKCFGHSSFESYYPSDFNGDVNEINKLSGKEKQTRKILLLEKVIGWIDKDEGSAKSKFENSAKEVIGVLQGIEKKLNPIVK